MWRPNSSFEDVSILMLSCINWGGYWGTLTSSWGVSVPWSNRDRDHLIQITMSYLGPLTGAGNPGCNNARAVKGCSESEYPHVYMRLVGPSPNQRTPLGLAAKALLSWQPHSEKKKLLKQYPWGTIATNGTLFSKGHSFFLNNHVPLCWWGTKTVPLGAPNYRQANSTPRDIFSVPFFLSAASSYWWVHASPSTRVPGPALYRYYWVRITPRHASPR